MILLFAILKGLTNCDFTIEFRSRFNGSKFPICEHDEYNRIGIFLQVEDQTMGSLIGDGLLSVIIFVLSFDLFYLDAAWRESVFDQYLPDPLLVLALQFYFAGLYRAAARKR